MWHLWGLGWIVEIVLWLLVADVIMRLYKHWTRNVE